MPLLCYEAFWRNLKQNHESLCLSIVMRPFREAQSKTMRAHVQSRQYHTIVESEQYHTIVESHIRLTKFTLKL